MLVITEKKLFAFTVFIVVLAIIGGFRAYSPIPFWDMWDGYLNFYMRLKEGDFFTWFMQHNEHRIVWSHILFWIDLRYFGGLSWFLIVVNYLIASVGVFVFWCILYKLKSLENLPVQKRMLGLFITATLFLWMQIDNFIFGFQSQFFLAQLLPLCALYWMYRSSVEKVSYAFPLACLLGVASAGTMANGVIALPVMFVYALFARQKNTRLIVLLLLSVIVNVLYFYNYQATPGHGSLSLVAKQNPLQLLHYVFLYLGSPFSFLFFRGSFGAYMALIAGLFFVGSTIYFSYQLLFKSKNKNIDLLALALLFFIFYIGGTALGTAAGRAALGVGQALSARYTTPALMAWVAILLLYVPTFLALEKNKQKNIMPYLFFLMFLMGANQLITLLPRDHKIIEHKLAALALSLNIRDDAQISTVYPSVHDVTPIAEKAIDQHLSIFNQYPYRDAKKELGSKINLPTLPACPLSVNMQSLPISNEINFIKLQGSIPFATSKPYPDFLHLVNMQGEVVGYIFVKSNNSTLTYRGYLLSTQRGQTISFKEQNQPCLINITVL